MSMWRGIGMMVAVALAGGCSLLVSTDGLVGPTAASDASTADASDASTSDGPLAPDAADSATAKPYCASLSPKPKFCADFDTGQLADFEHRAGTISLETAVSTSPPRSLLAVVERNAPNLFAHVQTNFPDTPASYEVSFDAYVAEYDATHDVELMTVRLMSPDGITCTPDVSIRNGFWRFDEYCVKNDTAVLEVSHDTKVLAPYGRWVHVALSVSFTPTRTYSLSIDDQQVFAALPLAPGLVSGPVQFYAGIAYMQRDAISRSKIYFDNIRFDFK
jgi:hypothetical protein